MEGVKNTLSGKDERKVPKAPRCPECEGIRDFIIKYSEIYSVGFNNNNVAGWVLSDTDAKRFGVGVIINIAFSLARVPLISYCVGCKNRNMKLSIKAIKFFEEQIRIGNYITWEVYSERNRNERKG